MKPTMELMLGEPRPFDKDSLLAPSNGKGFGCGTEGTIAVPKKELKSKG